VSTVVVSNERQIADRMTGHWSPFITRLTGASWSRSCGDQLGIFVVPGSQHRLSQIKVVELIAA